MRLTASLLEDWPTCGFKTKLRYFDHEDMPLTREDVGALYFGRLAHAGQDAYLNAGCPDDLLMVGPAIAAAAEKELGDRLPLDERGELVRRCMVAVKRWAEYFKPAQYQNYLGPRSVNTRWVLPLDPPLGVFDEYVIQPDWIAADHSGAYLWDFKWVTQLGSEDDEVEALRFDLQSVVYQYGLFQLNTPIHRVGHVRGLREEPTAFRVNQDGFVSRRPIRNSYEAYVAACTKAGHEPDPTMQGKLLPFFRTPIIYRSESEVRDLWNATVAPRALEISRAMEVGFTRRLSRYTCQRCVYRDPCWEGARGRGSGAFATVLPVGRRQSDAITSSDLD